MVTSRARKTVLVVDDSEDIRELLRLQVSRLGYRVAEASNGREAVEAVSKEPPALILMDLTMPVLDGIGATRLIRELAGITDVVIVAFTALDSGRSRQMALAAGCNDYVQKPLDMEHLAALLKHHLQAGVLDNMSGYLARQMSGLRHGDHSCLVYESEQEHVRAVVPFIAEGLRRSERCYYVGSESGRQNVSSALRAAGVDAEREFERGALSFSAPNECYLRSGKFDMEEQFGHFSALIEQTIRAGFAGLRHTGQMEWALGPEPGCDGLIEYEAKLNDMIPGLPLTGLCQYDRRQFSANVICDAIRTHPVVVRRDEVCPNHLYEPPELFLDGRASDKRVEWMLKNLKGEKTAAATSTILIVDDDQELRSSMKRAVETMGYHTVRAEDDEEMIATARREHPNLILTNTDLGWLDKLFSRLRQDEQLRFLPVAAVYPERPEEFQDERLIVLDDYDELVNIL